jgi:hypothetical protein
VACKCRISKPLSLLWLALCCTVLRSRWYQSGINKLPVIRSSRGHTTHAKVLEHLDDKGFVIAGR